MKNFVQNVVYIVMTGLLVGLATFGGAVRFVHAETYITGGVMEKSAVWDVAGSPYLLKDSLTIPPGVTLTLNKGAEVRTDPSVEGSGIYPYIRVEGTLFMVGSEEQPVQVGDIWGISFDHGNGDLSFADIRMRSTIDVVHSRLVVANTTVSNTVSGASSNGLTIIGSSDVAVFDSRIEHNDTGISIVDSEPVVPVLGVSKHMAYAGEDMAAILRSTSSIESPTVVINDSSIADNGVAVENHSKSIVGAQSNWWGNARGPVSSGPNRVVGDVLTDDWIDHDPTRLSKYVTCCSSVLFIPGLEASRLYSHTRGVLGIGTTTNTLWEPNRNADVKKLFLAENGTSLDSTIYAGGPIGKAFGLFSVYDSFMGMLDTIVASGTIREWKSFGYDWRKPVTEVVAGHEQRATTTESLVQILESLAARSKTGKVTLIGHSNGGLVAKALVKTLVDGGKESLIDSVISVAVPSLGTPQAITALLHGHEQSIGGGIIATKSTMREFGRNMASAYVLVPSAEYFRQVLGPTIAFASTTVSGINNGSYPVELDTAEMQNDFIVDQENSRVPDPVSTGLPIRGNEILMNTARIIHGILDPFTWPATIAHWVVIGWGNKTTKQIKYSAKEACLKNQYGKTACQSTPVLTTTKTNMGDGTVVAKSAEYDATHTASVNLKEENKTRMTDFKHATILETPAAKTTITDIITADPNRPLSELEEKISRIPHVTLGSPDYTKESTYTVVSTHSPVELHAYDAKGNHTGIIPQPSGLDIEEGMFIFTENKIPGGDFELLGSDEDPETYISLPDDSDQMYRIEIKGLGIGQFTYRVERQRGGEILDSTEYAYIPVTPLMIASTTITTNKKGIQFIPKLASSTPPLWIDFDNNSSIDLVATSSEPFEISYYLEVARKTIVAMSSSDPKVNGLVKKIDSIIRQYHNGKFKQVRDNSAQLREKVLRIKGKTLTADEKAAIISMVELFIEQFE